MIEVPEVVKKALRKGMLLKNWRFEVEAEGELPAITIDNDNLKSESVELDEKTCSGESLKFGLCEGSTLQFQYFSTDDKTIPNIRLRSLWAYIDVQYIDTDGLPSWYTIPMGRYDVSECSRQASTGIIKATCYNKLKSDYLDNVVNDKLEEIAKTADYGADKTTISTMLRKCLDGYSIEPQTVKTDTKIASWYAIFGSEGGGGYEPYNLYEVDSEGERTGKKYFPAEVIFYFTVSANKAEFYRVETKATAIINKLLSKMSYLDREASVYDSQGEHLISMRQEILHPANETAYRSNYCIKASLDYGSTLPRSYIEFVLADSANSEFVTDLMEKTDIYTATLQVPVQIYRGKDTKTADEVIREHEDEINSIAEEIVSFIEEDDAFVIAKLNNGEIEKSQFNNDDVSKWSDVTLRELQSAVFETECQFGKLNRVTDLFSGMDLNGSRLLPADTLYPDNALYPGGGTSDTESMLPSVYSKLWADEGNVRTFKNLIITYKTTEKDESGNDTEVEKTMTFVVNEDGTNTYEMDDNWLFKNLVWTDAQITEYGNTMAEKMKPISWFPYEAWCAGLPYVETGDELEIFVNGKAYTTYVLERTLKGIQNLQDEYIEGTLDIF